MKIVFISHASVLNGAPITLAELVEELLKDIEPGSISLGLPAAGMLLQRHPLAGAEVFFYARSFTGREILVTRPRIRKRLRAIFAEKEADLVVANSLESFRAVQAAADVEVPVIWMLHELLTSYCGRRELEEMKEAARLADRVIFNSRSALELAPILGEGIEEKSRVIYPGVPLPPPDEERAGGGGRPGEGGGPLLGSVGDICPQKGHESLIRGFGLLLRDCPSARLMIIGRTPGRYRDFRNRMETLCRELGIGERVVFRGERIDLPRCLRELDLLIHPSWGESFGRVVVEALAREVPVVASRSGGVEEILTDGSTGLLIPPRDPEALAAAARRMITRPAEAREMACRGRQAVEERFAIGRFAGELKREMAQFKL
ncbi:MAG: glycosyltransferase family 4 protein [PVC group bacterium]